MNIFRFRHTLTLMLAAVFFWGCSDISVSGDDAELSPMRFSTTSLTSRAVTTNESFLQTGNKFKVWGSYKSRTDASFKPSEVFDGVDVTRTSEGVWSYDNPRYWLPGFCYDFRAIHPVAIADKVTYTIGESGNDTPTFTITDYDAVDGQHDILYAASGSIDASGSMKPVALDFKHLLSRITFVGTPEATLASEGRIVYVRSAALYGMSRGGSWSAGDVTGYGTWTTSATDLTGQDQPYAQVTFNGNEGELTAEGVDLFPASKPILMIPQAIGDNFYFQLDYFYNDDNTVFTQKVSLREISAALTGGWQAGRSYRYRFTVGMSNNILFAAPMVDHWEDAEGGSYNVDLNN